MERRKVRVSYDGQVRSVFVNDDRLKTETLDRIFGTKGNLTYKIEQEIYCLELDDANFILEDGIDDYFYEDLQPKDKKTPSGITASSRKRLADILTKLDSGSGKKKTSQKKIGCNKQETISTSKNKNDQKEDVPESKTSEEYEATTVRRTPSYKKRVVHVKWLHKCYGEDTLKPKGLKIHLTLNGATDYSFENLKKIIKTQIINEQSFSSRDFEGCKIDIGKPNGEPIINFTDHKENTTDIWTYAAQHRDGNHNFKLCFLTTKIQDTHREYSFQEKNSPPHLHFEEFGYKNTAVDTSHLQKTSVTKHSISLSSNYSINKKESTCLPDEEKKNMPPSSTPEKKKKDSTFFPDASSLLKKQDFNVMSGGFGYKSTASSIINVQSETSAITDDPHFSSMPAVNNKENSPLSNKESKDVFSSIKSTEKSKESTNFPDARSMLNKKVSNNVSTNNQVDSFKRPANPSEQVLMSVSINKIELCGSIAEGGQGQVKKGIFRGTPVAVKYIQKGKWDKCALKEISLLAMLRHPHIICAIAQSSTATHHVIVMEFFEGASLGEILLEDKYKKMYNLNEEAKMQISKQVCMAVNFCHTNEPEPIIHRDIKPSNILVNTFFWTKLCDFGLGRCKDLRKSIQSTMKAGVVGTYGYMPPEIIVHGKEATVHSDTWSTGAALTELFNEQDLWGNSISGIFQMVKMEKPNMDKVPGTLKDIFSRIFSYNPEERPTMKELLGKF